MNESRALGLSDAKDGLAARILAAKNRFKTAIDRAPEVFIRSSDAFEPGSSSLVRAASAFAVAAAAANPAMSLAAQESLDAVKPVAFLNVNGQTKYVLPQASIFDVATEVANQLGSEINPAEVFTYLVYAHGMDWQSMVACHGLPETVAASQLVAPLVREFQAAHAWSIKKVKTGSYFRVEARMNYMLSSTQACRAWVPGAASLGDAKEALRAYVQAIPFKSDEVRELARSYVNEAGFYSVSSSVASALAPVVKGLAIGNHEIFEKKKDEKTTILILEYDNSGRTPEAQMLKMEGADEPIGLISTSAQMFAKGTDPRVSKIISDIFITHEQAHLDNHVELMVRDIVSEDLSNIELQANLISAKNLLLRTNYTIDEIMEAHSHLGMIESESSISSIHAVGVTPKTNSYAQSRRQTMELLNGIRSVSRDRAIQVLTQAIESSKFALDVVLSVYELQAASKFAHATQDAELSATSQPSSGK